MAIPRSLKGTGGKKYGHTKDVRPPAEAVHPIVEAHNNSDVLAEKQLKRSQAKQRSADFSPTDNAQYR
jgi:hypothetical protein